MTQLSWLESEGYSSASLLYEGPATRIIRARRRSDMAGVIIKLLTSDVPSAIEVAKLQHEHNLLLELQGSGVTRTYGITQLGHHVALVMEDVGGSSLDRVSHPLNVELTLKIAIEVTKILRRCHKKRIVHLDIKPHNIVITNSPFGVYLIDWGIATHAGSRDATADGKSLHEGTPAYIAPEQTGLVARPIDGRTDLYSLGVALYELFTSRLPFVEEDAAALVRSHQTRIPPSPHEVAPGLPVQISAIVMKLLAKSAEERYATAYGLECDLQECLKQWKNGQSIKQFALGLSDKSSELRIPQKLYGREADLALIMGAFERARQGAVELLVVTGHSGIGKSAVVVEARGAMRLAGVYFAAGKSEQFQGGVPYAPVLQALRNLLKQVLSESADAVAGWSKLVRDELGAHASTLCGFLPELRSLIGTPPAAEHSPSESEIRLRLAVQGLLSVFAKRCPVVLFLDDLQWADLASLNFIEQLLTTPEQHHILLIGAYRDHDLEAVQLLLQKLQSIADAGVPVTRLALTPMGSVDVERFVADALDTTAEHTKSLSEEILRKTDGNPFFVAQLMTTLVQEGLVSFDEAGGIWRWDLGSISKRDVAADVATFMTNKLRRLDQKAQELLMLAACLGTQLEHSFLANLSGQSISECAHTLWDAITSGLLVPLHENYRLLREVSDGRAEQGDGADELPKVWYRFVHDRVQEAAHSLGTESARVQIHLRIARIIHEKHENGIPDELIFTVADHWNAGLELVERLGDDERHKAAAVNLRAGRQAKASVAYEAALTYLSAGIRCLPPDTREGRLDVRFALKSEYGATMLLVGRPNEGNKIFDELVERARDLDEKVQISLFRVKMLSSSLLRSSALEVIRHGREVLAMLGAPLPESEEACQAALESETAITMAHLTSQEVERALSAAPLADQRLRAMLEMLVILDGVAMAESASLSGLISLRQVLIGLRHGPSEFAAIGYATCGLMFLRKFGKTPQTELLMQLARLADERWPNAQYAPTLCYMQGLFIMNTSSYREANPHFERGVNQAWQGGSMWGLTLCGAALAVSLFCSDVDLVTMTTSLDSLMKLGSRAKCVVLTEVCRLHRQTVSCLKGETQQAYSLSNDQFDEEAFLTQMKDERLLMSYFIALKLALIYIHRDYKAAIPWLGHLDKLHTQLIRPLRTQASFYGCLILCELLEQQPGVNAERWEAMLDENRRVVAERRAVCEISWRCYELSIEAAVSRKDGKIEEAERLYEQAIDYAEKDGFIRIVALASEDRGRSLLRRGHIRLAHSCMRDALSAWRRWGAIGKAKALEAEFYGQLFARDGSSEQRRRANPPVRTTIALQNVLFDLSDVATAFSSISSEIITDHVVKQFLQASFSKISARKTMVVLSDGDRLSIAGEFTRDGAHIHSGHSFVDERHDLSVSVVRHVARMEEPLCILDRKDLEQFEFDPYLQNNWPIAVICLPLMHNGRLIGVWYAEVEAVVGLRQGMMELLQMLASHAANALANSKLYRELEDTSSKLLKAKEQLESLVAARTEELRRETKLLQQTQTRLVKIEKIATEGQMAGGFAHEIRNALCPPAIHVDAMSHMEQTFDVAAGLRHIFLLCKEHMPEKRLQETIEFMKTFVHREKQLNYTLERVRTGIDRCIKLTSVIEEYTRHSSEQRGVELVDLGSVVRDVVSSVANDFGRENISMDVSTSDKCALPGRARHLQLILTNILSNSRDALTGVQDRERRIGIHLAKQSNEFTVLQVTDNGAGISAEHLHRIFEPFFTTMPSERVGIGLNIVERLMLLYDGSVQVDSTWNVGTTVTLRFFSGRGED